jgi:hypothetical protein
MSLINLGIHVGGNAMMGIQVNSAATEQDNLTAPGPAFTSSNSASTDLNIEIKACPNAVSVLTQG